MSVSAVIAPTDVVTRLDAAIDAAAAWLYRNQAADGHWVGKLESNCCMEAQWLLAMHFLDYRHPRQADIVQTLLNAQRSDGSWEIYYDAPDGDINTTVECYAALRANGFGPDDARLRTAREWIFAHGGLRGMRVFSRYWLALIGEWPWPKTPNLPPEPIFLPHWVPLNLYHFASWARATIVPLAVLSARRAVRPLPRECRLDELFPAGRDQVDYDLPPRAGAGAWHKLFLVVDKLLHAYHEMGQMIGRAVGKRRGMLPGRESAVRNCLEWVIRHQDADGAWGGIQPPWIYSLMALNVEGYPLSHPVMAKGLAALDDRWSYTRDGGLHIEASQSPVWDTLLSMLALLDCRFQLQQSEPLQQALGWVLEKEVRTYGDWQHTVSEAKPGGWAFEYENAAYPDVDDTAVALIVLARLRAHDPQDTGFEAAISRAVDWMLAMQSDNGGWAAFDKNNDRGILTKTPFADFGEALDPPSADVTAHVLEALGLLGYDRSHPSVARGRAYLLAEQEPEGSWFGRWGVNHIYGTAAALPALHAIGEDMRAAHILRAARWLVAHQNPDGGWGETCASYVDDRLRGTGPSTASQTAWALLALLCATGRDFDDAIRGGLDYLLRTQRAGTWDEPYYTGTGFPGYGTGARTNLRVQEMKHRFQQGIELQRGFMINYNLYRHYFPLMALGRARAHFQAEPLREMSEANRYATSSIST